MFNHLHCSQNTIITEMVFCEFVRDGNINREGMKNFWETENFCAIRNRRFELNFLTIADTHHAILPKEEGYNKFSILIFFLPTHDFY